MKYLITFIVFIAMFLSATVYLIAIDENGWAVAFFILTLIWGDNIGNVMSLSQKDTS